MRPIVFVWSPGDSCPRQRATNAAKVSAAPIALGIRGFGNGTDRKRVGVVRNRNNPNVTVQLRKTEDAVRELNLRGSYLRGIRARIHTPGARWV
jgi:hypothetical protein